MPMVYDVREIANFVLDCAERQGRTISNMQVNKIVYFLHAECLASLSRPLVSAKIEAWQHGPVFREIYSEFKRFGENPITARAAKMNPETGKKVTAYYSIEPELLQFLEDRVCTYSALSAAALRAQSHVTGGPWDEVWNHDSDSNASMKISDDRIKNWYERTLKH